MKEFGRRILGIDCCKLSTFVNKVKYFCHISILPLGYTERCWTSHSVEPWICISRESWLQIRGNRLVILCHPCAVKLCLNEVTEYAAWYWVTCLSWELCTCNCCHPAKHYTFSSISGITKNREAYLGILGSKIYTWGHI